MLILAVIAAQALRGRVSFLARRPPAKAAT